MDEQMTLTAAGRYRLEKYSTWEDGKIHLPVDCVIVDANWVWGRYVLNVLIPDPEEEADG